MKTAAHSASADMCKRVETGRECRANYQQQHHVLEILTGFSESSGSRAQYLPAEDTLHPHRADAEQPDARHSRLSPNATNTEAIL